MHRTRTALLALSVAAVGAAGFVGWRMMRGRGTATPTATSTPTADPHPPDSPAAREAALLRSLAEPAAAGPPPASASIAPLAIQPQIVPRLAAETRSAADAAAEVRAAFDVRGRAVPTWPPLDESDPPPGPRLDHAQRPARKVARAPPAVEVPDRLDRWGE